MSLAKTLRKVVQKHAGGTIHEGFMENELWCSCGNYAMNRLLSGSYYKGFMFGKTVAIAGESGSGKSLVAATGAGYAQRDINAMVVWLDVEGASNKGWLEALGINTDPERFVYMNVSTIADVKKLLSDIVKEMKKLKDPDPVYMVVDSYGMLLTDKEMEEAEEGELIGDLGQNPKQVKNFIKAATALIGRLPICIVGMAHSMASSDKYNPDDVITGGRGIQYAASQVLLFNKLKMKAKLLEDATWVASDTENDKVVGIRCKAQVHKSRFSKPFEKVYIQIPYPRGMDAHSGLFDLMLSVGEVYQTSQGWYAFKPTDGEETKFQKKGFREHADDIMRLAMAGKLELKPEPETEEQPE